MCICTCVHVCVLRHAHTWHAHTHIYPAATFPNQPRNSPFSSPSVAWCVAVHNMAQTVPRRAFSSPLCPLSSGAWFFQFTYKVQQIINIVSFTPKMITTTTSASPLVNSLWVSEVAGHTHSCRPPALPYPLYVQDYQNSKQLSLGLNSYRLPCLAPTTQMLDRHIDFIYY